MKVRATLFGVVLPLFLLLSFSLVVTPSQAGDSPTLNKGKKWRIGYYEGGPYSEYTDTMRTLVKGLIQLGWILDTNPPELYEQMPKPYWDWLSRCNSPYLSFSADDAYSADWDDSERSKIRALMMKKLESGELDLVLAMGTWAGQDLANDKHSVPTMVLSTSDPIGAGIIKSAENSGLDHVTARVDPTRYSRQIRMFHRIAGFKTLGLAYENTPDGRIYSAVDEVMQISRERGFKVITCQVIDTTADTEKSNRSCIDCYQKLAREADAIYVTALACVDRQVPELAAIFKQYRKPSFSMIGSKYVQQGIMLSLSSDSGYAALGKYNAMKFGEILNGTKPGRLNQVLEDPLEVAVNLETARQIGFNIPKSILRIASEIYEK